MSDNRIKIAIAGGGIAGLALAAGLAKKPHIDVHVYEAVPAYKDVGAGLALHLNAIKAMALTGPEVRQAYFDKALTMGDENQEMATEVILAQGPHMGQLVAELGRAKGRKTVSRADLLDGFLALIPRDCISFGKRLVGINEQLSGRHRVGLTFQDGTEAAVDCLLGADGVHSMTRSYLLGADHPATSPKNHDGWQIYRTMVPTEEAKKQINPKWTTSVPILLGPRGHINCIPLNKNTRLSAGVAVRGAVFSAKDGQAPPLDPALYADYSEEAQQIVRMVARDTSASWTAADHDHAPYYARGHVAMFGDAAHASLPFAGNGAAQALEDAAVLDYLFAHVERPEQIPSALRAFDEARRGRSQAVVDLARRFGRVYAYAEDGMHEDPVRMKKFFGEMAAFTNEFDVGGQNDRALDVFVKLETGNGVVDGMDRVNGVTDGGLKN
ncbi:FAD/NAD(P)-binding domain-containing protein [Hypoxylon trugodes]|uniref:FAD/NAD(P)-binding domain-containing protein n=1 Tax=Hypoxylon trugodes TaxID=326681 RepID=UPI0021956EA6|nr:FAD/NAD(P)-binding domain-containing protein [Hypoxylon trugodes]KAI1390896.1 FAD/NAD(P)-binding domain-containing protein [Hypoxylon trugodes]